MATARISRWARRFLLVSAAFLVAAQVADLAGAPRRVVVALGLYGFVTTTVFGKAYSLVPAYFDRALAWSRAPQVQLPLATAGVVALAVGSATPGSALLVRAGTLAWVAGVAVFLGTLAATVWDNPTGAETGTGEANAERAPMDRLANAFVPVAFAYLAVAAVELTASVTPVPTLLDGGGVRIAHLLGPGFALVLLFAVGYRLLPRFLSATPPRRLAWLVLPAGALAPALLAVGYPAGALFRAGAVLESVAVVGFALTVASLVRRSDRHRIGFYGPLVGTLLGCLGVGLGLQFAFVGFTAGLPAVHLRLNVFGLLGLSIVGVVYQFYPPAVADWPGVGDRSALASIAGLGAGLAVTALAPLTPAPVGTVGRFLTTASAGLYGYVLLGTITSQT